MKKLITGLIFIPVALVGCSGQKPEKERYISATKDIACMIFKSNDLFDPSLKGKSNDIYKKYGFGPSDSPETKAATEKYRDDAEAKAAVEQAIKDCGGDISKKPLETKTK